MKRPTRASGASTRRGPADGSGGARRAEHGRHRHSARSVPRARRSDLRRRERGARRAVHGAEEQLDAARRRDVQDRRARRSCAAATACSTASSASAAATSSRPASAANTPMTVSLDNGLTFHRDAVESVPRRHHRAGRRGGGHRDLPRPVDHVLRRESEVGAQPAVAGRHPARAARPLGRGHRVRRQPRLRSADRSQPQLHAEPVPRAPARRAIRPTPTT